MVKNAAGTEDLLIRAKQQLTHRRRQLFHEISEIFPIVQVTRDTFIKTCHWFSKHLLNLFEHVR